jgi:hypothetical protein
MIRPTILAVFLILLLSELLLRLFFEPPRLISFVQHDFELGHTGPKNEVVDIWSNPVTYGSHGFRVLPADGSSEPGVLWLGDSMVEAITIPDSAHLLSILQQGTGLRQEMLAAGDWGSLQKLLAFRRHGAEMSPRIVVMTFSSLTDFVNNQPAFANRYQSRVDDLRPYARPGPGEELEIFYRRPIYLQLRELSHIFLFADNARLARALARVRNSPASCERNINSLPLEAYLSPPPEDWEESVRLTAGIFRALRKDAERAGARLLLVFLPSDFDLIEQKWRQAMSFVWSCHPGLESRQNEIERKFFQAAELAGAEAYSITDPMGRELRAGREIFLEDGHYSEAGHAAAAKALLNILRDSGENTLLSEPGL